LLTSKHLNKSKRDSKLKKKKKELGKLRRTDWQKKLKPPRELPLMSESNWRRPTTDSLKLSMAGMRLKDKSMTSKRRSETPRIDQLSLNSKLWSEI